MKQHNGAKPGAGEKREPSRLTMTVPEAAALLGLGRSAAYEAARRHELPVVRIGRRLLVPKAALEKMMQTVCLEREVQR